MDYENLRPPIAYVALVVAILSMLAAASAYYTYQSNRMTGHLKIAATYDTEDQV